MNILKKTFAILSAAILCLSLTACGNNETGADWRTWGIVRDGGTITRNGEDTDVLVCVNKKRSNFYYNTEGQVIFDFVEYPSALADKVAISGDVWSMFKGIDFADLNGDGNSDVTMKFDDSGSELVVVWFWDTESGQFIFQPDESQIGDDGRGDLIPEYDDEGNPIPEDDGRGDLIPDEGDTVPILMGGALPFTDMESLQSENREDGTYYYADSTEDGHIIVVNTVLTNDSKDDSQTVEDYLISCALGLRDTDTYTFKTIEENVEYTKQMSYPVYIVSYTAGENENVREWTVFAMDTDCYTYLYGFSATLDAADNIESIYQNIFAGLYLSDGE